MACYRCPGSELKGSGYCKIADTALAKEQESALQRLLAERQAQDARVMAAWAVAHPSAIAHPVDPNPPAPRAVSAPGSTSTTSTRDHGIKSAAVNWQSR
jgi:hypothetical protein